MAPARKIDSKICVAQFRTLVIHVSVCVKIVEIARLYTIYVFRVCVRARARIHACTKYLFRCTKYINGTFEIFNNRRRGKIAFPKLFFKIHVR